jgi:signal transduction histidine kinase
MLLSGTLGALNQRQIDALQVVRHRADRLLRLLNDVLDFSKLVSGELKVYPVVVNLSQAVRLVVERFKSDSAHEGQRLLVDIAPKYQYALADDHRLNQILVHLVDNAIKFSPEGRPVVIRVRRHDDNEEYVRIDVIDQGIGIQPEDIDLVFEDFRQVDGSFTRDYGGAGLGLAICRHLVELQGGIIWAESEHGQGSTFSFILPRA